MPKRTERGASAFAHLLLILWFLLCSGGILPLLLAGDGSDDGNALLRLFLLPNLMAAPIIMVFRARTIANVLQRHPVLVALVIWIWMSVLWSVEPGLSARRALSFTANTLIACFVITHFEPKEIIRRLLDVSIGLILLSLVFALLFPTLAFMPEFGELRGVFTHKNGMGGLLVWTFMLIAVNVQGGLISRSIAAACFTLVAALVVPTGSATALMLIILLVLLQIPIMVGRLPGRLAASGQMIVSLGMAAIILPLMVARNQIFMAIGRDPTVNGRTELWAFVRSLIDQRPLQGYGYQAFFDLPGVAEQVLNIVGWPAPNAHNGYLEVWLGLGIVGLGLALWLLVFGLIRAWMLATSEPRSASGIFAFLSLGLYLTRNFSESDMLDQVSMSWILALLALLIVGMRRSLHTSVRPTTTTPSDTGRLRTMSN